MTKLSFAGAFAAGLAVLAWIALGFVGASWLPLAVTVLIAGAYLLGAHELRQFRAATAGLDAALAGLSEPPARLADWLQRVPASLREPVRMRVEGERGVLPGPALTPYLVGLLVMLGMLGTFLGMVVTFQGAVFALEGSTDLAAIRGALAAPIKGLGLSFGTSVAGVAASAMLGLMSAIARRERLQSARTLDARIGTTLQPFSLAHQRQESLRALQAQAGVLPEVAQTLRTLMERIERRSEQLDTQLLERHAQFQREVTTAYGTLATSVGSSLQQSLAAGAQAAGTAIRPVVESAMAQVVGESQRLHEKLATVAQAQADALSQQFAGTVESVNATLARQQEAQAKAERERLSAWTASLQTLAMSLQSDWQRTHAQVAALVDQSREDHAALVERSRDGLAALREEEARRGEAAVARLGELQGAVAQHLADLGAALEAPLTRLLQTASEVPQAAAGVITELRQEMSRIGEKDNLALQERTQLLEQLRSLMQAVNTAAGEQRTATEALVASASSVLEQAGTRFTDVLAAQGAQAGETAAQVAQGAHDVAQLATHFQQGVQQFQEGNEKLIATLARIEASLVQSTARSDEQLAYYVAQAREVIDLSISSQQTLVEQLRQVQAPKAAKPAPALEEARA
ncbi:hypothetical protein H8N03_01200 [Ramlibacter sp. USB13]|uniref:DUF802 domain-containing protein n=1 Tax=Ramlibacter cellulosilyticus TaxID=2764187 RepID=A0A923S9A0_9BURK|nr:hypothetical protein [Ramlibacter cellulosilyticus]MBC5781539.1 hypothetical protein [Ramlibacter cellulosilyticus]